MASVLDDTTTDEAILVLHELEAELPQECDYPASCAEAVEWEVTCRWCHSYAYVCNRHQRVLAAQQVQRDLYRGGQRCNVCEKSGREAVIFSPIRSRDGSKLW